VADPGGHAPAVPALELRRVPTVALGGDTMLGRLVGDALRSRPAAAPWSEELLEVFGEADLAIVNLECCISERGSPWDPAHKPFHFRAPPQAVETLAAAGVRAVWLANNHALDYGPDALLDTFEHLARAGIAWAGAGRDLEEARRSAVIEAAGVRIGLVGLADHPADFAAAPDRPGIAFADLAADAAPGWLLDQVRRLRQSCDLVVVGPHWGPNMLPEPRPHHPRIARQLLAAGAAAVAGHSAHVFQPFEVADGRPILYDLGDLLDDYAVDEVLRNDLGVLALWRPGERLELVPLKLEFCFTDLARGDDHAWVVRRLLAGARAQGREAQLRSGRVVVSLDRGTSVRDVRASLAGTSG
jgi:poly-gamma-glutamate synthesis protein (capsule biosynthesis protein)